MRSSVVAALSLVAGALALQVTSPDSSTVWASRVSNIVSWTSVDTDPANFTIALTNQGSSTTILLALVNTTQGSVSVPPTSNGFPIGNGLQINLLRNATDNSGILAQSAQFNITENGTSSAGASSTINLSSPGSASTTPLTVIPVTTDTTPTGASDGSGSDSAGTSLPTPTGAALSIRAGGAGMLAGMVGMLALLV